MHNIFLCLTQNKAPWNTRWYTSTHPFNPLIQTLLPSSCGHWASLGADAGVKCVGDSFPVLGQTRPVCSVWWRSGDVPCPGSCPLGWARWWIPAAGGSNTLSPHQNAPVSPLVTACAVGGWRWLKWQEGERFGMQCYIWVIKCFCLLTVWVGFRVYCL